MFIVSAPCGIRLSTPLWFPENQGIGPLSSEIFPKLDWRFHLFIILPPQVLNPACRVGRSGQNAPFSFLCIHYPFALSITLTLSHQLMMTVSFLVGLGWEVVERVWGLVVRLAGLLIYVLSNLLFTDTSHAPFYHVFSADIWNIYLLNVKDILSQVPDSSIWNVWLKKKEIYSVTLYSRLYMYSS